VWSPDRDLVAYPIGRHVINPQQESRDFQIVEEENNKEKREKDGLRTEDISKDPVKQKSPDIHRGLVPIGIVRSIPLLYKTH